MGKFKLLPKQKVAIEYVHSMVITACPGSGKTTVISKKIRNITPTLPKHKGVIAISFTIKASQELKNRCTYNAHKTQQSFFGTIDSFCLKEIIIPFLSRLWGGRPSECKILKKLDSHQKLYLQKEYKTINYDDFVNDEGFRSLYDKGIIWMSSFSVIALHTLKHSVAAQQYIKSKYTHIFIDEYQDSSEVQHELFLKIIESNIVGIAVGDIDQSIYGFRGGNSKFIENLVKNKDVFKHFKIDFNHRSHPSITNYASRLIKPDCELLPCKNSELRVIRRTLKGNPVDAAVRITDWISSWLKNKKINYGSNVAILARKESTLRLVSLGMGIPFRLNVDTPLDAIGTVCSDLYTDILFYRYQALVTTQELIDKYIFNSNMKIQSLSALRKEIKKLRTETDIDALIEQCMVIANKLGIQSTEREEEAIRSICDCEDKIKQFQPADDNEVLLMTLHKSKGLEFKIIFHMDLEEWSFPYQEKGDTWDDISYPSLEQDTNLHYVGITRAEDLCVLIRTELRQNSKGQFKSSKPSCFLNLPQLNGLFK